MTRLVRICGVAWIATAFADGYLIGAGHPTSWVYVSLGCAVLAWLIAPRAVRA